ncbi:MAG: hypothetical protein LAT61_00800 [Alcanivorax sp.]|nr:hypothetical protein [Alcanivorax sp.]
MSDTNVLAKERATAPATLDALAERRAQLPQRQRATNAGSSHTPQHTHQHGRQIPGAPAITASLVTDAQGNLCLQRESAGSMEDGIEGATEGAIESATESDVQSEARCPPEPIAAYAEHLPPLSAGDQVLAISTQVGWVVTARLVADQAHGNGPAWRLLEDGRLAVQCDGGLVLQAGEASIEILADGAVRIDGNEVHTLARGTQRIQGAIIQIN